VRVTRDDGSVEFLDHPDASDPHIDAEPRPHRRRTLWVGAVAAAAVLTAAIVSSGVLSSGRHAHRPSPLPTSSRPTSSPLPSAGGLGLTLQESPVVVRHLGAPVVDAPAGEEVFARGPGFTVRIDLGRGVVTRTVLPGLRSSGEVSFLVLGSEILVRPFDRVPGYAVPDGRFPQDPLGVLALSGPAWPGPAEGQAWVDVGGRIRLVDGRGRPFGPAIPVPPGASDISGWADGRGYLLFQTSSGWYEARPERTVRVTPGNVIAVGAGRYLVSGCRSGGCVEEVVDRATGRRTALGPAQAAVGNPGVVSPDDSVAARADPRTSRLLLTDLDTGRDRSLPVLPDADRQALAWAPDGRWLFAADRRGHLQAVDARTARIVDLSRLTGGPVTQVAARAVGR
jgi:hypothetical protein